LFCFFFFNTLSIFLILPFVFFLSIFSPQSPCSASTAPVDPPVILFSSPLEVEGSSFFSSALLPSRWTTPLGGFRRRPFLCSSCGDPVARSPVSPSSHLRTFFREILEVSGKRLVNFFFPTFFPSLSTVREPLKLTNARFSDFFFFFPLSGI